MEIELGGGLKLVAEQDPDAMFGKGLYVGIEKDGEWVQDLAIVRNAYDICDGNVVYKDKLFDVLVYADENNEDYTHDFHVPLYEEEE